MWLFVPGTSSHSAQASEASNSASCSPCTIGERLAEASATWRGKPRQPQAWSRAWKQGGFIRLLSGPTCSPSTLDHGVAALIYSLRETPAKRTASPASALDPQESDSSPPRSLASPRSAGLILSSARTSQGTRTSSSRPSLHHWKGWASALRQEYSVRPKPVIPCDASDCSSWPSAKTATGGYEIDPKSGVKRLTLQGAAVEWMAPVADDTGTRTKRYAQGGTALSLQATDWSTPKASDEEKGGPNQRGSKGDVPLPAQAVNWPAPGAGDDRGPSIGWDAAAERHAASGVNKQMGLRDFAPRWEAPNSSLPPSSLDQPIAAGSTSSTASPNSNQPSVRRKLNPIFVEALMRWPTGLSGFERQATAWTRWWLLMPSFLSTLCSPAAAGGPEQIPLFGAAA